MPNLSYDGQSFLIDARRIWLVSASLDYSRIAPENWPASIAAVRQAGMNCIEVIVPWRVHEPAPGQFHFKGQANLRKFVQLIIAQGMFVTLRPGPYIGQSHDLGGLPAYLLAEPDIQLRQANPAFLQAAARYLGKVMAQVHDLQITSPRRDDAPEDAAGENSSDENAVAPSQPVGIVLVQAEHQWLCHHPKQSDEYLTQIVRYLRENNCQVPISLSNNLWQQVDGTIDTWHASTHLASDLRQLRMIQPDAPRIVSHLSPAAKPDALLTQLACATATGGQYNLDPFIASDPNQINAGRTAGQAAGQVSDQPAHQLSAPLTSQGCRTESYFAIKRIATLASQFSHVLAHALPASQPAAIAPASCDPQDADHASSQNAPPTLFQQQGPQGTLIFILNAHNQPKDIPLNVLLPDGQMLPVPLGNDPVAWIAADVNLSGTAELTLTNLRPWAWIGKKMLVLFGPAGSHGLVVINDASITFEVPTSKQQPHVLAHEDLTIVILNEEQIDTAYPVSQGLMINTPAIDEHEKPITAPSANNTKSAKTSKPAKPLAVPTLIDLDGRVTPVPSPAKADATDANQASKLSDWQKLTLSDQVSGKSDDYRPIDGFRSIESLAAKAKTAPQPYGWYHVKLKSPVATPPLLASPASGGSMQFFVSSKNTGTLHAQHASKIKLAKEFVILAHNPGRYADGWRMAEPTGLAGDLFAVKPLKLPKPALASKVVDSPLTLFPYLQDIRHENREMAQTITWSISLRSKAARIFAWENFPLRSMLLVNDQIAGVYDPALSDHAQQVLLEMDGLLRSGKNELTLAILEPLETLMPSEVAPILKQVKLYEASRTLTENAELRYATWTLPDAAQFGDEKSAAKRPSKNVSDGTGSSPASKAASNPCWHRATFDVDVAQPFSLTVAGPSQGQVYLNHHPVASLTGKTEHTITLPTHWLHTDKANELLVFDNQPGKALVAKLTRS